MVIIALILLVVSAVGVFRYGRYAYLAQTKAKSFIENAPILVPIALDDAMDKNMAVEMAKEAINSCIRDAYVGLTVNTLYVIFLASYLWRYGVYALCF